MRQWDRDGHRVAAINLTLPLDAIEILRKYAATSRGHGDLLARLLYEHEARQEARQHLRQQIAAVVAE
jgi:hypothetical protein